LNFNMFKERDRGSQLSEHTMRSIPNKATQLRYDPQQFLRMRSMSNATGFLVLPEWIATATPGQSVLRDHAVAVDLAGNITAVGPSAQLTKTHANWPRTALPGHLLTPGLINLHTHASMTLLRGSADDLPLESWLQKRIWPLEAKLVSPEFVYDGAMLACAEMLLGGVTTFQDMYFYQEEVARAAMTMGMRAGLSITLIDFPTAYASTAKEHLSKGLAVMDQFRGEPQLQFVLAPHAPYSVSDETFTEIVTLAEELDLGIHCHIHETAGEVTDSLKQYGQRPLARLANLGLLQTRLVAAHAVHLSESDIDLLKTNEVALAHCPHSNLKLASGIADLPAWIQANLTFGIGTDSAASNNRLDVLGETRTAALLANRAAAQTLNCHNALHAMTLGAAKALGLDGKIGEIAVGKRADLVAFDLTDGALAPVFDPLATLIYAAGREHVASVWINGRIVVQKRQLVGSVPQRALSEVTGRIPLWHNRVGDIVSAVA
jgi:5-methylthioadenosine/S-adenosylhomocysteine deaminase